MQVYCPQCATTYSDLEPEAFADGACDTCDGQLITGEFQLSDVVPGAVAMTFETGSRVAIPFLPQFDAASLDGAESISWPEEATPTSPHGSHAVGGTAPAMMGDDLTLRDDSVAAFAAQAAGLESGSTEADLSESTLFDGNDADDTNMPAEGEGPDLSGAGDEMQLGGDDAPAVEDEDEDEEGDGALDGQEDSQDLDSSSPGALSDETSDETSDEGAPDGFSEQTIVDSTAPDHEEQSQDEPSSEDHEDQAADGLSAEEPSSDETSVEESAVDEPAAEESPPDESSVAESAVDESAAEEPVSTETGMPAHLSLPSIDFSMPDIPGVADAAPPVSSTETAETAEAPEPEQTVDSSETVGQDHAADEIAAQSEASEPAAAPEPSDGLPAHLQLPSFPAFDINFDPAAAAEKAAEAQLDIEEEQLRAAEVGLVGEGAEQDATAAPAHLQPGAVSPGPPPPPPPLKKKAAPAPAAPLPGLPNLGSLPDLAPQEMNREPTLLGSDAMARAAQIDQKSSVLPLILGIVVLVLALGGVGFWQKDAIVTAISGDTGVVGPKESDADKAKRILAEGLTEVDNAKKHATEDKKKKAAKAYQAAISKFREAVKLQPKFARAHRELAVVYATVKKEKKAVDHYRKYSALAPEADDADAVKKIITDWEKAQKK